MNYRKFGKTGWKVSEIGLGTWQLIDSWNGESNINIDNAKNIITTALNQGINFFDTADVYSNGLSEKYTSQFIKELSKPDIVHIATKVGRKLNPHTAEGYNQENITKFIDDSLRNMQLKNLDLVQLHCPPTAVYKKPEVFEILEDLQAIRKIKFFGVSVEKVEEALQVLEYDNVTSIQIIFNMFRLKPAEELFDKAKEFNKAIIVRVPLASGLLSGKFTKNSKFSSNDHRYFNRDGKAFDKGETFSGVDYEKGLQAVDELKEVLPTHNTLAQYTLKWILMFDAVSTVIPGASSPKQVVDNSQVSDILPFSLETMNQISDIYNKYFRQEIHNLW